MTSAGGGLDEIPLHAVTPQEIAAQGPGRCRFRGDPGISPPRRKRQTGKSPFQRQGISGCCAISVHLDPIESRCRPEWPFFGGTGGFDDHGGSGLWPQLLKPAAARRQRRLVADERLRRPDEAAALHNGGGNAHSGQQPSTERRDLFLMICHGSCDKNALKSKSSFGQVVSIFRI
jgi:hypothetical protein